MPLPNTSEGLFISTFGDLRTTNQEGDQENNQIDFAEIVFQRDDLETKIKDYYLPIEEENIDIEHQIAENDDRYFIFGYP